MNHTVNMRLLTKVEGRPNLLHEADDKVVTSEAQEQSYLLTGLFTTYAVTWLECTETVALGNNNNNNNTVCSFWWLSMQHTQCTMQLAS